MIVDGNFQFPALEYFGHKLFFILERLYIEDADADGGYQYFGIPDGESIVSVAKNPKAVIDHWEVKTKNHQYVLIGGPQIAAMYLVPIK